MSNNLWSVEVDLKEGNFFDIITKSVEFDLINNFLTFELYQVKDKKVFEVIRELKDEEPNMIFTLYKNNEDAQKGIPDCVIKIIGLTPSDHIVKFENVNNKIINIHVLTCVFDEWMLESSEDD